MDKNTQKKLLGLVDKNYEKIAEGFAETRGKPLWREITHLMDEIEEGSSLLDVGCGSGRLLRAFKNKEIKYLGVDSSQELIGIAKKEYPDQRFLPGNILHLGELSEYDFDYVVSIAVIHHLPGEDLRVQALKQLKNKIKPDGRIIITAWNLWSQKKYRKLIWKFFLLKLFGRNKMDFGDILFDWRKDKDIFLSQRYYHAFTKAELKKIVKKAGLKIDEYKKDKYNYYLVLKKF
ncbi:methyltransferase domain-containing protein [Candidatus Falkowbacteria bacterium]|nr:methyltransferase domain-containing protein [Candidatus Falkowbacteria bacterium]